MGGCILQGEGSLLYSYALAVERRELDLLSEVVEDLLKGSLTAGILVYRELTFSLNALKPGMEIADGRLELSLGGLDVCVVTFQTDETAGGSNFSSYSDHEVLQHVVQ